MVACEEYLYRVQQKEVIPKIILPSKWFVSGEVVGFISGLTMPSCSLKRGVAKKIFHFS